MLNRSWRRCDVGGGGGVGGGGIYVNIKPRTGVDNIQHEADNDTMEIALCNAKKGENLRAKLLEFR
jgi:hypothetical protein